MKLEKVEYSKLNARQKENFNFQKVSAVLADYGFVTLRLSDDWHGADFIALHISGFDRRVQLKGRLTFDKKYLDHGLDIVFPDGGGWYLYPHDELLEKILAESNIGSTRSWQETGTYHFAHLSKEILEILKPYRIVGDTNPLPDDAAAEQAVAADGRPQTAARR
jgi:hypothetical protein